MDFLERAAASATTAGVDMVADVYGEGREVYDGARGIVRSAQSAVNAGVDIATDTAQYGYDTVERGVAGAIPGVVDTINDVRPVVERPIDWAVDRAGGASRRVANAASDAWSWMTD